MTELKRLLRGRFIVFLALLLILNFSLMYISCDENKEITLSDEALNEYVGSYGDFIEKTIENGEKIAALSAYSDGFAKNNILESTKAYEALRDVVPVFGENRGIVAFSDFRIADAILIGLIAVISLSFSEERGNGTVFLTRSTSGGRTELYMIRTAVLLIFSLVLSALITLSSVLATFSAFGAADLLRPVQSVPEFRLCTYKITILGYIIISAMLKALAAFTVGAVLHTLSLLLKRGISVAITAAFVIAETVIYGAVLPTAEYNHIRYGNVAALLFSDAFFKEHYNINFFTLPVNFLSAAVGILAVFAAFAIILGAIAQIKVYPKASFGESRIILKIRELLWEKLPTSGVVLCEGKKLLIYQAGIICLVCTFLFAYNSATQYVYAYGRNYEQEKLYNRFSGDITVTLRDSMQAEKDGLEEQIEIYQKILEEEMAKEEPSEQIIMTYSSKISALEVQLRALIPILENAYYAVEYTEKTGVVLQNIKPYSYNFLLYQDNRTVYLSSLYILIGIICTVSGVFACENSSNMKTLIRTTKRGRIRNITVKLIWASALSAILAVSVHMIQYSMINELIGFEDFDAIVQSIPCLREFPLTVTLGQYLIILFSMRAVGGIIIALAVSLISKFCSDKSSAICISAIILALPSVLFGEIGLPIPTDIIDAMFWIKPI